MCIFTLAILVRLQLPICIKIFIRISVRAELLGYCMTDSTSLIFQSISRNKERFDLKQIREYSSQLLVEIRVFTGKWNCFKFSWKNDFLCWNARPILTQVLKGKRGKNELSEKFLYVKTYFSHTDQPKHRTTLRCRIFAKFAYAS